VLASNAALARDLAAYATRVRAAWSGVRVEHVEASGVGDSPERGTQLSVRAYVALGELTGADVLVELASGRVDHNDRIVHPEFVALTPVESYDGNRWRYEATVSLDDTGPFGYTVRVLPSHQGLHDPAELGLQALPLTVGAATD
jgi:starch phosphorylase